MAVNIHITIIELNALHTKRQNLFQELDAVIHLLMEAKHWGLRKSRNATSLNSRFKSLDTLKVKIISVTFRRVIRTNHKKASKIWKIGRAVQQECRDRSRMPSSAGKKEARREVRLPTTPSIPPKVLIEGIISCKMNSLVRTSLRTDAPS